MKFLWCGCAVAALAVLACTGCGPHKDHPTEEAAGHIVLSDVTDQAGIHFNRTNGAFGKKWMPETFGGGGAFIDYDNDGYLDILLVNGDWWPGHPLPGRRPTIALYHNNRNGTFTDVTHEMGLDISLPGMGAAVGDFDGDGYDDLFISGVNTARLLHNEGGKGFKDATAGSGLQAPGWCTSAAWLDYNGDGKLDLFVCHYAAWTPATDLFCGKEFKVYCTPDEYKGDPSRLYRNDGHGHFKDVTKESGVLNQQSKGLGVLPIDFDGDGLVDIVVANDKVPNFLFHNNGNGTFKEVGMETGMALDESGTPRAGMGVDAAEYRRDGAMALAVGNFYSEGLMFIEHAGAPPYSNRAKQAGVHSSSFPYVTFGLVFSDLDNDGFPDLVFTNGQTDDLISRTNPDQSYMQPTVVLRNRGDGTFSDVSKSAGPGVTRQIVGRGLCHGDFDNDGREDILLIPNTGPAYLLHNDTPAGHWITLKLIGTRSNRNGYGARVQVQAGGRTQTSWCRSGGSYLSASDSRVHFGLGSTTTIDKVSITWPSGTSESWSSVKPDQVLRLTEGTGTRNR